LVAVMNGEEPPASRRLGEVRDAMARHGRLLAEHYDGFGGEPYAMRNFRKHTSWYLSGYPVGPAARRALATISSLAELDDRLADLDPALELVPGGERIKRGHTNGPIKVALPDGYLDHL